MRKAGGEILVQLNKQAESNWSEKTSRVFFVIVFNIISSRRFAFLPAIFPHGTGISNSRNFLDGSGIKQVLRYEHKSLASCPYRM